MFFPPRQLTSSSSDCPPLVFATDPIAIAAASYKGRNSVRAGKLYKLLVTLTLPADNARRELKFEFNATKPAVLDTFDYALLLVVPDGATYKRTAVKPALKPWSLKKPEVQTGGDLLWEEVPMSLYATQASTRTFYVTFRVAKDATSPLVFEASVWKDGSKLYDAAPVTVTVVGAK